MLYPAVHTNASTPFQPTLQASFEHIARVNGGEPDAKDPAFTCHELLTIMQVRVPCQPKINI